ncbi:MAG TPA: amino acid permease, partial [Thermomicrobiales bacterium]|nr:amino acid permease [Thermomicrobiales bacterium]
MPTDTAPRAALRRALGLRAAVALGVGGTIGGGIFVLVGAAAGRAGPGALLAFGLAFLAAALIALPYAELACRYPLAGGGYAFVRAALGPHWGFLMGWGYWGAYVFVSGYVTLGFGGYLHGLTGLPTVAGALALVAAATALNLGGVRLAGGVQTAVVVVALAALAGFGLLGLPHLAPAHFAPLLPHG